MIELTTIFDETLMAAGFERKKKSWYRILEEIHQIVNLQKSNFGDQYYLNLGIQPSAMAKSRFESENKYPLRLRYDGEMFGNNLPKVIDLSDPQKSESAHAEEVKAMLLSSVEFLDRVKDIAGLKAEIMANKRLLSRSVGDLRTFLGL